MNTPRVSIFMTVRNGMPFVTEAIDSVRRQTFRDFELVVQDGASTDGTLEFLRDVGSLPGYSCVSAPDSGIAQGANRALARCRGEIIGSIDADNLLEPDAIERAVGFLDENPDVAVVYGGANMVAEDGALLYPWIPGEFDLLRVLCCELVPPFPTSFFVRRHVGDELVFDESIRTVPDFDLWLRLSHLPIRRLERILGSTRVSAASGTQRVANYDAFVRDKSFALERYLERFDPNPVLDALRARALAGIRLWAAESVYGVEGGRSSRFERYLAEALALDPASELARRVGERPRVDPAHVLQATAAATAPVGAPSPWSRAGTVVRRLGLRRSSAGSES